MQMDSKRKQERLAVKYFEGSASPEERRALAGMLEKDSRSREELFREEQRWQDTRTVGADEKRSLSKLICRLDSDEKQRNRARRELRTLRILSAAAALALVVLCSVQIAARLRSSTPKLVTVCTKAGQGGEVTLPDGTKVILRANTTLNYPASYSAQSRSASLVGDAYFDVKPDPDHPFQLGLGKCSISVLGTQFDVSAPGNGSRVKATLLRGAINFSTPSQSISISPGESVSFNSANGSITTSTVDAESYLALMEGRVEYYDVTIAQLAKYLEGLYGIPIILDDALAANNTGYSLRLSNRESFEEVIAALRVMLPMGIRYEGEKVWLTAK